MCHTLGFKLLGLKRAADDKLTAALCLEGRMFSVGEIRGLRLAPLLLNCLLRGERVPKQTSAEATNGKLVST
jgi:hypothetical protein